MLQIQSRLFSLNTVIAFVTGKAMPLPTHYEDGDKVDSLVKFLLSEVPRFEGMRPTMRTIMAKNALKGRFPFLEKIETEDIPRLPVGEAVNGWLKEVKEKYGVESILIIPIFVPTTPAAK